MKLTRLLLGAFFAINFCCLVGCSNPDKDYRYVTGTVTLDGAPLDKCIVSFIPQDAATGEGGSGLTDEQGKYEVTSTGATNGSTGLKPGLYKVTVLKNKLIEDPDETAYENGEIDYDELQRRKSMKTGRSVGGELITPRKFIDPQLTPLSVTVSDDASQNVFDFNLDE